MSQANKYLNNTIFGRYNDQTPDATLSKVASNLLVTQEELGYNIVNTKDFPKNTVPESKYACYDFTYSMTNYMIFHDLFFQLAFEKYDDIQKIYKTTVRHFLLKTEGSIWVKQIVYAYPRSIFTLSDSDRAQYTKQLLALPGYNEFVTYYSSVYALNNKSPSLPLPCDIGIGSGCFKSEFDYYIKRYNDLSAFGNMSPQIVQEKTDIINAFFLLTGEDITSIGYNSNTGSANANYLYNNMLMNKIYSTGQAPIQQGALLNYVADNQTIANNQTNVDTQTLSPGNPLSEPSSVVNTGSGSSSGSGSGSSTNYIQNGSDIPVDYGSGTTTSGIGEDAGRYFIDDYIIDVAKEKCWLSQDGEIY